MHPHNFSKCFAKCAENPVYSIDSSTRMVVERWQRKDRRLTNIHSNHSQFINMWRWQILHMGNWTKKTGTNHLLESQVAFQTASQQLVGHWSVHNTFQCHPHHTEVKFEMLSFPWSSPIQIKRPWMPFLSGKEKEMCSWPICSWSKVPSCNRDGEEPPTFCWPHLIWNWVAAMRLID